MLLHLARDILFEANSQFVWFESLFNSLDSAVTLSSSISHLASEQTADIPGHVLM